MPFLQLVPAILALTLSHLLRYSNLYHFLYFPLAWKFGFLPILNFF